MMMMTMLLVMQQLYLPVCFLQLLPNAIMPLFSEEDLEPAADDDDDDDDDVAQ